MPEIENNAALLAMRSLRGRYKPLGRLGCVVIACAAICTENRSLLPGLSSSDREKLLTHAAQTALRNALQSA